MDEELTTEQMIESVGGEAPAEGAAPTPEAQPPGPWWQEKLKESVEYDVNGKKISEPLEMVFRRAGLGYHAAQKIHQTNQQLEKYKDYDELKSKAENLARWQEYDDYARANPEWAQHVEQGWANREQALQQNPELSAYQQKIKSLEEKLSGYDEKFSAWEKTQQEQKFQAEDVQFNDEIQSVAKKFGVDLTQSNDMGESLEWRVLNHMQELGLNGTKKGHFEAAFKDYYFDNLLDKTKEQTIENHAKSQAELKRQGIRDISRAPKQDGFGGYRPGMSSKDLDSEALAFLRSQQG